MSRVGRVKRSEAEIAPTQLDVDVTQVTPEQVRTSDAWSPLKPAQLFAEAPVAGEDAGGGMVTTDVTDRRTGEDGAAKGFYSEPEDVAPRKAEIVLEQAATWEYWQPPPPFQVSVQCLEAKKQSGEDVITRFDNAGRLTTLRRKADVEGKAVKTRRMSLSQVTPPTPAAVKVLRPASDVPVLFGTLLVLEVLRLPMRGREINQTTEIGAVAYCIRDERVRSLLADSGEGETYEAPRSDSDTFPMSQAV
eukprot:symbB.v1.2.028083.t1/scaffold2830.1/size69359/5